MSESNGENLSALRNLGVRMEALEALAAAQNQQMPLFIASLLELSKNLERITTSLADSHERMSKLEESLEIVQRLTNLDSLQTALEKSATNYRANLNTLISENLDAFDQQIEEIKTAFHENDVILTETNELITGSITTLPQQMEHLVTDSLQMVTDELVVIKQEIAEQTHELVVTKQELIDQKATIAQINKLPRHFFTVIAVQSTCLVVVLILIGLWITNSLSEQLLKPRSYSNTPTLNKP